MLRNVEFLFGKLRFILVRAKLSYSSIIIGLWVLNRKDRHLLLRRANVLFLLGFNSCTSETFNSPGVLIYAQKQ